MTIAFETEPIEAVYEGNVTEYYTFEMEGGTQQQTTMIHSNQTWGYHVEWTMEGVLIPMPWTGDFHLTVYLEDMSPADKDKQLGPFVISRNSVPINPVGPTQTYTQNVFVAPGTVPDGVYKPSLLIQLFTGPLPWPVASFADLPLINIYQVPPLTNP